MGNPVYNVLLPHAHSVPVVLSAPHVGVDFPDELRGDFRDDVLARPEDTDWFVHELYEFAPELGITMIHARYSRYVIDLNRTPDSAKLYDDGRRETGLLPIASFDGTPIYARKEAETKAASAAEIARRLEKYYWPYYREIERRIAELAKRHRHVLFFDAHSIRPIVRSIQSEAFPDLILGDQDGHTAHASLIRAALDGLRSSRFQVSHNHPFKGGQLTRYFGKPASNVHALQLEMSQSVYMNEARTEMPAEKLRVIRPVLRETLARLIRAVEALQ